MIEYKYDVTGITGDDLNDFFEGWNKKPSPEKRLSILKNSDYVIIAYEDNRVIGFINAVTDETLSAYIPLLEVLPEYRQQGIGSGLIDKMLELLKDYYMIDLCCDTSLAPYYKKLGFTEVSGMIKRNYNKI